MFSKQWRNEGAMPDDLKEALAAYERAIALDAHNAIAHLNKGDALKGLNRDEEALTAYEQAIDRNPHNAIAFLQKSDALRAHMHYAEALASYEQAIRLDANLAAAYPGR